MKIHSIEKNEQEEALLLVNASVAEDRTSISKANMEDLQEILQLQYLAYQSEAALFDNNDIPPLKQTLDEVIEEYHKGIILKLEDTNRQIIGSIRAREMEGAVYVGKLMVHPDHRHRGYGARLLSEIEKYYPHKRYELFTSTRSIDNIRLYQRLGYQEFDRKRVDAQLEFVYMDKMIGYCGINCEKCEARIATVRDDNKMREDVSRKWCEIFHTDIITPDKINCTGCRGNGVKYFFCSQMCEIKPCVTRKGYESCAECAEMDSCAKLAAEICNNEKAKENLRRIKAIHHGK